MLLSRAVRALLWTVAVPVRAATLALLRIGSRTVTIHGLEVVDSVSNKSATHSDRLGDALRLISAVRPTRLRRLQRCLRRIVVTQVRGPEYDHFSHIWFVPADFVLRQPTEWVALSMIYASTEARLQHGKSLRPIRVMERIGRIGRKEQIAFARGLSEADHLVNYLQEELKQFDARGWTMEELREFDEARLRGWRVPEWMIRLRNFMRG
jgi:hypothetical protein